MGICYRSHWTRMRLTSNSGDVSIVYDPPPPDRKHDANVPCPQSSPHGRPLFQGLLTAPRFWKTQSKFFSSKALQTLTPTHRLSLKIDYSVTTPTLNPSCIHCLAHMIVSIQSAFLSLSMMLVLQALPQMGSLLKRPTLNKMWYFAFVFEHV